MANLRAEDEISLQEATSSVADRLPLWELDVVEVTGHNLEARGRDEVNRLLAEGWRLLHIYTLRYQEDGVWRERPMAILGRLRNRKRQPRNIKAHQRSSNKVLRELSNGF
jgi:hypothetical protein